MYLVDGKQNEGCKLQANINIRIWVIWHVRADLQNHSYTPIPSPSCYCFFHWLKHDSLPKSRVPIFRLSIIFFNTKFAADGKNIHHLFHIWADFNVNQSFHLLKRLKKFKKHTILNPVKTNNKNGVIKIKIRRTHTPFNWWKIMRRPTLSRSLSHRLATTLSLVYSGHSLQGCGTNCAVMATVSGRNSTTLIHMECSKWFPSQTTCKNHFLILRHLVSNPEPEQTQ